MWSSELKISMETTSLPSWLSISRSLYKQELSWSFSGVYQWIFSQRSGFLVSSKSPKHRRIYMRSFFLPVLLRSQLISADRTGSSSFQEAAGFKTFSVGQCSNWTSHFPSKYKVRQRGEGGKNKIKAPVLTVIPVQSATLKESDSFL